MKKAENWNLLFGLCSGLFLFVGLGISATAAQAETSWMPTLEDIRELEGKVRMPKGAVPLKTFTREYAGRIEQGHQIILGVYSGSSGQIVIVNSEQMLHASLDGGCGIVEVKYDLTSHTVVDAFCHEEG